MTKPSLNPDPVQQALWTPSLDGMKATRLASFVKYVSAHTGQNFGAPGEPCYRALHRWSVENKAEFWSLFWDFAGVLGDKEGPAITEIPEVPWARFFPQARINYTENMLRHALARPDQPVIIYRFQGDGDRILSGRETIEAVSRWEQALRAAGVGKGDCVGVYLTNVPETDIILMAAANIGAVFCSAGMEMGPDDMISRFGRVHPKVFVTAASYVHGAKRISRAETIQKAVDHIPAIQTLVILPANREEEADFANLKAQRLQPVSAVDFLGPFQPQALSFIRHEFNHPLYVLFSSGTTGEPKCFEHSTGGVLLKHLSEYVLQADVRAGDRMFFHATPSWMMWNWLASGLAAGATILKYDGSPGDPDLYAQLRFTGAHGCTHHGTAAPVIMAWAEAGLNTRDQAIDLGAMRSLHYTGAVLPPEGFTFIGNSIKAGIPVSGMSGGTDLCASFIYGNPFTPVYAGQVAGPILGMELDIWDDEGKPCEPGQPGELVCTGPFPSMPLRFLDDPDGVKYRESYFDYYGAAVRPVWRHGDTIEITPQNQIVIIGRSDATLNQNGVRIGPIKLYEQLTADKIGAHASQIKGYTAVDLKRPDNQQAITILFLALETHDAGIPSEMEKAIRQAIKDNVGPYSVPTKIMAVPDVLRTKNGKLAEVVTKKIINGKTIGNPSLYGEGLVTHYEEIGKALRAEFAPKDARSA